MSVSESESESVSVPESVSVLVFDESVPGAVVESVLIESVLPSESVSVEPVLSVLDESLGSLAEVTGPAVSVDPSELWVSALESVASLRAPSVVSVSGDGQPIGPNEAIMTSARTLLRLGASAATRSLEEGIDVSMRRQHT